MLKKLAAQTAIYGISSIIARFLNYLLTPYLTRIMTTGEYGVVTDLYALIPFILLLLTMGMETGYFHFAGKAGTSEEKRLIFQPFLGLFWRRLSESDRSSEFCRLVPYRLAKAPNKFGGAGNGAQTRDLCLGKAALYQLSYSCLLYTSPSPRD